MTIIADRYIHIYLTPGKIVKHIIRFPSSRGVMHRM